MGRIIAEAALDDKGDADFLWSENDKIQYHLSGKKIPNNCLGINEYDQVHNIICLRAANPAPAFLSFLIGNFDLTKEQIYRAIQCENLYQMVCRTSIRTDSDEIVTFYVPDRESAEFLSEIWDGCTVEKLLLPIPEDLIGKPRKGRERIYQSDADRQKAYRVQHTSILNRYDLPKEYLKGDRNELDSRCPKTDLTSQLPLSLRRSAGTVFKTTKSWYALYYFEEDSIFPMLREKHERKLATKKDNQLFSPAIFDPSQGDGSTKRGYQNIVFMGGFMVFDFENGQLTPEDLIENNPNTPMWISNSFSSTKEEIRFHAIIPLLRDVSVEEHHFLWDQFVIRLEAAGFSVGQHRKGFKRSGLDTGKRPACSLFYFPCQAEDPENSFSYDIASDQTPLDPDDWLSNPLVPTEGSFVQIEAPRIVREAPRVPSDKPVDLGAVRDAEAAWLFSSPGTQNDAFHQLAISLFKAGMQVGEIETNLRQQYRHANHPSERLAQIKPIIEKLEGWVRY